MKNVRRHLVAAVLLGAAGALAPTVQAIAAEPSWGANKFEGAWVAKDQASPMQWSYVLAPDSSGRRATLHGSIDVGADLFGPGTHTSPLIGELVMTGPTTAKFNSVWYVLGPGSPGVTATVLFIGVNRGEATFVGPRRTVGKHNIAFYDPTSDVDGDGYPDADAVPIAPVMQVTTKDVRLPAP